MYNNGNYYGNNGYGQGGYDRGYEGYGPAPRRRKPPTIYLDQKGYEALRRERFNDGIKIREYDVYVAKCVHKDPKTGAPAYRSMGNGFFKCDICGTEWPVDVVPVETVAESCKNIIDSLQQVKVMLDEVNIPKEPFGEIIPIEAVLKVYPKLLDAVVKQFSQSVGNCGTPYLNRRRNDFDSMDSLISGNSYYGGRTNNYPGYTGYNGGYDDYNYDRQPEEYYRPDYGYNRGYDPRYDDRGNYDRPYDRGYDRRYDNPPRPEFGRRDENPFRKNNSAPRPQAPSANAGGNNGSIPISSGDSNNGTANNNNGTNGGEQSTSSNWRV